MAVVLRLISFLRLCTAQTVQSISCDLQRVMGPTVGAVGGLCIQTSVLNTNLFCLLVCLTPHSGVAEVAGEAVLIGVGMGSAQADIVCRYALETYF